MATAPVLQGSTLAHPFDYKQARGYRLAAAVMADSTISFDRITTNVKRRFVLDWRGITTTQRNTILTAYEALITGPTSSNFTDPEGTVYTVTMEPGREEVEQEWIKGTATVRWNVSITLREV